MRKEKKKRKAKGRIKLRKVKRGEEDRKKEMQKVVLPILVRESLPSL